MSLSLLGRYLDPVFYSRFHISHDLQLLIDSGDADAPAALSDHTADTDGWDDDFLPGYASGASDDGDLF